MTALALAMWAALAAQEPTAPTEAHDENTTIWSVPVAHAAGLLAGMRLSLSALWPEGYDPLPLSRAARQFTRAYTAPPEFRADRALVESDGDPWTINVIGHGLFGMEVYGRVRRCGGSPWAALAFTTGTSALWEYGVEAFHKRPSAIDLVATPLIGMVLGEARYRFQSWLAKRPAKPSRRALEIFIDPLGEAERGWLHARC